MVLMSLEPPHQRLRRDATSTRRSWSRPAGSGDRGLGGCDCLDRELDPGRLADEESAGFESDVPGEPEVLAVDVGDGAEADALVAHRGGAATVEVDLQGDGPGGAAHGQVALELPGVVAPRPHRGRCECDGTAYMMTRQQQSEYHSFPCELAKTPHTALTVTMPTNINDKLISWASEIDE